MGYDLFDCVIPTREARHKKLYIFKEDINSIDILRENFYYNLYGDIERLMKDKNPVSSLCDCHLCKNYSRAYLYNLFKANDSLAIRFATLHNLRFYSMLTDILKQIKI